MIWKTIFLEEKILMIPRAFNETTMMTFLSEIVDEKREAAKYKYIFDFQNLDFIEPVGIVVLSNVIEYIKISGGSVKFRGHSTRTAGTVFLDDALFFDRYLKKKLFNGSSVRPTTIPLSIIHSEKAHDYLLNTVMPWIGASVNMMPDSLSAIRVSLEEVLHNVRDHSGVKIGCSFIQHFPNKNTIQIAISDFGNGIPSVVRTKISDITDPAALRMACNEGFTTKSNVQNRGAGLPTLMKYVTQNNGGNVLIASGYGAISVAPTPRGRNPYKITTRTSHSFYPGTLVRVILRTDTLDRAASDAVEEEFTW